jgi:hypothetical protein
VRGAGRRCTILKSRVFERGFFFAAGSVLAVFD